MLVNWELCTYESNPLRLKPADMSITASIGIATMKAGEKHDLSSLFMLADTVLTQAKEEGADRVYAYEWNSDSE